MNEVLKNTHAFVNILCMARCEAVQQWDEDAFRRAHKWAKYFEEVHTKLKNKPLLADKLDKYLSNFNKSGDIFLGNQQLMFQTLESSKQILKQCLLQNPHLSDKQFHMVMELYGIGMVSRDGRHEHMHEFLEDLFVLAKTKATLQVLSEVRKKLSIHCKQECNIDRICDGDLQKVEDTNDVAKQAVAQLIQRYMYHQYKNSGGQQGPVTSQLHEKFRAISLQKSGLEILLQLLLLPPESSVECPGQQMEQPSQLVLHWILGNICSDDFKLQLFAQPVSLLSRVAAVYISFFKVYLGHLIHWGESMVHNVQLPVVGEHRNLTSSLKWRHNNTENADGNYNSLEDHFRCLVSVAPHIRDICLQAVQTLLVTSEKGLNTEDYPHSVLNSSKPLAVEMPCIWMDIYTVLRITVAGNNNDEL